MFIIVGLLLISCSKKTQYKENGVWKKQENGVWKKQEGSNHFQKQQIVESDWNGVAYCVKEYLKENLHDPKSLKIKDAYTVTPAGEDYIQRVTYRAKNAFGATVLEDKVFFMGRVYGKVYKYEVYDVRSYTDFKAMIDFLSGN